MEINLDLLVELHINNFINIMSDVYLPKVISESGTWTTIDGFSPLPMKNMLL